MNGWQVQAMKEAEDARIWEELNAPDPFEEQLKAAAKELRLSIEMIEKVEDDLVEAINELSDTPMEYKVGSLLDEVQGIKGSISRLPPKGRSAA